MKNVALVIYNNNNEIESFIKKFPEINIIHGENYAHLNIFREYNENNIKHINYSQLNRSASFGEVFKSQIYKNFSHLLMIDADTFLYGKFDFNRLPLVSSLCRIDFILKHKCFSQEVGVIQNDKYGKKYEGVDLDKLMESINIPKEFRDLFLSGNHHVLIRKEDFTKSYVNDLNYWNIALKALCLIQGWNSWIPDMATQPLSFCSNGIKYQVTDQPEIHYSAAYLNDIPQGSFIHYGFAKPFKNSNQFEKGMYYGKDFFLETHQNIDKWILNSKTPIEKYFFSLFKEAKNFIDKT